MFMSDTVAGFSSYQQAAVDNHVDSSPDSPPALLAAVGHAALEVKYKKHL
jgi:hypothetical protein